MICFGSPASISHTTPAMTPERDDIYTPSSSRLSQSEIIFDWTSASTTSEADFSSLPSEPISPDRPCGLGLSLPRLDTDESHDHTAVAWQTPSFDIEFASPSGITHSGLPFVEPKYLTRNPWHENHDVNSISLPATPWNDPQTPFHQISHSFSTPCSVYSISSPLSQITSPVTYSEADMRTIGSPFIKIEAPREDFSLQVPGYTTTEQSPLMSPWTIVDEVPSSIEERITMFLDPTVISEASDTKPSIAQPSRLRTLSSDKAMVHTSRDRKKRKYTTQENAKLSCQVCGKLFQRKFNHRKHMETHQSTRLQPFTCEHEGCNKSFGRRTDLFRHEKSLHFRVLDHFCPLCGRPFARKDTLRRHMDDGCRQRITVKRHGSNARTGRTARTT